MTTLSEHEADRLMLELERASDAVDHLRVERANLNADLRLLHQNDPAAYHATTMTGAYCRHCGAKRGTT